MPQDSAPAPEQLRTIEEWCAERGTPDWAFAGLLTLYPAGKVMSGPDYDDAVRSVRERPVGR